MNIPSSRKSVPLRLTGPAQLNSKPPRVQFQPIQTLANPFAPNSDSRTPAAAASAMPTASSTTSRLRREDAVRAVAALLRWLRHHPTPAPEPIYLIVALKRTPVRRFEHRLRLPHSPFPSISLVSDRLPADLPDNVDPLPSAALRSLPVAARRGLVLVDRRIRLPSGKATFKGARPVPVDLSDPSWAESATEAARCVELRVESGTCRAVRVGHAAMSLEEAVENVVSAVEAAAACVPKKWKNVRALHVKSPESIALPLYSATGTGGDGDAGDAKGVSGAAVAAEEEQGKAKRRKTSSVGAWAS